MTASADSGRPLSWCGHARVHILPLSGSPNLSLRTADVADEEFGTRVISGWSNKKSLTAMGCRMDALDLLVNGTRFVE